jgi:hypothetical protein
MFSPGPQPRFIAYDSTESGSVQVYVQTFPLGGGKWQISRDGGTHPTWRRDGKELYYLSRDASIMAVALDTDHSFTAGLPRKLFQSIPPMRPGNPYDVSADGQKFLVVASRTHDKSGDNIQVIVNWEAIISSQP